MCVFGILRVIGLGGLLMVPLIAVGQVGMVTGSATGTYIKFGNDIATVAKKEGVDILVKESKGSLDNIRRISSTENAAFAIVQSDVLGFLEKFPEAKMRRVTNRLRVIFPFYNEEVHVVARKNIRDFDDLQGKKVVVGTHGSGTALTANNIFELAGISPGKKIMAASDEGLVMVLNGEADAMFYVAGKPASLFQKLDDMAKKRKFKHLVKEVHFLSLDDKNFLGEYVRSELTSDDYGIINRRVPTIAVKAMLVSFDFSSKRNDYYAKRCDQLAGIGKAVRDNIGYLRRNGHKKWNEVDLDLKVGKWKLDQCSRESSQHSKYEDEVECFLTGKHC